MMTFAKLLSKRFAVPAVLAAALALSACATAPLETTTRAAPGIDTQQGLVPPAPEGFVPLAQQGLVLQAEQGHSPQEQQTKAQQALEPPAQPSLVPQIQQGLAAHTQRYAVQSVRVKVPKSLKVSERNALYPGGDIVWREDPPGDRHLQVATIIDGAMRKGIAATGNAGGVPAHLEVEVHRFHAVTEKARYTIGGLHSIQLTLTFVNPETGLPLSEPKFLRTDLRALGGQKAVEAERAGITQKVRITEHLAGVIQKELTATETPGTARLATKGTFNQL